ncbi:tyrosine-type recombinase/integrase [Rhodococcoides fascians]|uniref:tyrosine-type recombinase/integrase n=1 Tax=Rhodococcoides fascians TaxID=1828 RepID=UPI00050C3752|nr:site-specific integrase [Rhodococcus fascians]
MARPPLAIGTYGAMSTKKIGKVYRARCRVRDSDGVVRQVLATGTSKEGSLTALREALKNRSAPAASTGFTRKTTYAVLAEQWLEDLKSTTDMKPQSIVNYRYTLNGTILPALGAVRLGEITASRVDSILKNVYRTKPGVYAPARNVLRQTLDLALRMDLLDSNPVSASKTIKVPKKKVRILTVPELARLRANVRAWQDGAKAGRPRRQYLLDIIDLLLATGGRIGEVLALRWDEDVDFDSGTIMIAGHDVWVVGEGLQRQDGVKHNADVVSRHTLPLFAMKVLARRRAADPDATLVFHTDAGGPVAQQGLGQAFRLARGEEFEWAGWHVFRKNVATLVSEESGVADARAVLGHASDKTTMKHYVWSEATKDVPDVSAILESLADQGVPDGPQYENETGE